MRTTTKVKTRNWSLEKFQAAVARQSKKLGVPAKAIKATVVKKDYEAGLTVRAAAERFKKAA